MIKFIKIILLFTGISYLCFFPQHAFAKNRILTNVKVIHASTGPQHVDPSLNKIISGLQSVFKYTSYRLIKDQQLNLGFKESGQVSLPGKRTLVVIPANMEGKRIRYQISIQKNRQSIFQTQVLLKNNSSITIGGPQFNNGVLLLNISGSVH
ncbi:MAG: hypothetical protein HOG03_08805 [Desulfobacula sp.]|jgi:hypothetical protein|uniref:hypothetical protein n=1 Tax=Desulfobacula sp. TaxID=2593537 RepID=UPI001E12C02C|nr:hypothetical protein [Desulfobacula sp.]MBT3484842.1 hypothetical protein [Desulfobacula sp.]MBT3804688.1 hypothetical protein [Desulfobacula sp.]MBT4024038.1 hypothetical protein [Desulfobacula sp.]MBT4198400.1 hypothetical protein [Desulfobacula sp.]